MNWDSEVETAGRSDGPGWRGKRFEIPPHMRSEPYVRYEEFEQLPLQPYREVNFGECVRKALKGEKFVSHDRWLKSCRYLTWLWSPPPMDEVASQAPPTVPIPSPAPTHDLSEPVSGLSSPKIPPAASFDVVQVSPSGRKRPRGVDDDDDGPPQKRLDSDAQILTSHASPCQLVVPSDTDSNGSCRSAVGEPLGDPATEVAKTLAARAGKRSSLRTEVELERHRGSSQSESEVLEMTLATSSTLPSRRSSRSAALRCSVILIDKDEKETVWPVTNQILEDIQGYLRVKAVDSPHHAALKGKREPKDEYDASGSDVEVLTHALRRKRKSMDDGVAQEEPDSKKKRKSCEFEAKGVPVKQVTNR
jgi:hypothetical protein